jgi:hypothetical protein
VITAFARQISSSYWLGDQRLCGQTKMDPHIHVEGAPQIIEVHDAKGCQRWMGR